ncbi:MAG TPA: hypothetical protein PK002_03115 [Cellvibrio sp.]|nr:hypothetical protein [Cellvibrio sp.]
MLKQYVRILGVVIFFAFQCAWSAVDVISAAPDSVDLTIFRSNDSDDSELVPLEDNSAANEGLLMVNETRTLDLPAGESRILLRGVADAIIPQTAKLQGVDGATLESNFDYMLLTPFELLKESVGQQVTIARTNPTDGNVIERTAIIKSSERGVVLDVDGKLEAFLCDAKGQKIIFNSVPLVLIKEPSLSVTVRTEKPLKIKAILSYLAVGAQWQADYVATINPNGKTLDLSAWMTLLNARNTTFANAPVQVVAGKVEYDSSETKPPLLTPVRPASSCWSAIQLPDSHRYLGYSGGDGEVEEIVVTGIRASLSELGDYKLYRIPNTTTFSAHQSKQVLMLSQMALPFERLAHYTLSLESLMEEYEDSDQVEDGAFPATTILRLMNNSKNNLGVPLPQGNISVMAEHAGRKIFVGQNSIKDQPVGLPVDIQVGDNPEVLIDPRITKLEEDRREDTASVNMDVRLKNYSMEDVVVEIQLPISEMIHAKIRSSNHRHQMKDGIITWRIKLAPNASSYLRFELFTRELEY